MRGVLIFVFGLICLAGFYYGFQQNQRLLGRPDRSGDGPFGPVGEDIEALEIGKRGAETIRIQLKNGRWALTSPLGTPADGEAVKALLSAMAGVEPLERVEEAEPGEFGFEHPYAELSFYKKGARSPVRVVQVGHTDSGQRGRYLRLQGEGTAFLVSGERIRVLTADLFAVRDKTLLGPLEEGPRELAFQSPDRSYKLAREEGGWAVLGAESGKGADSGDRGRADPYLVEEVLETLAQTGIRAFIGSTPPDRGALTLRLIYGKKTDWLRVWPPEGDETSVCGRSSHQGGAFRAPAALFRGLDREAGYFLDRRILVYEPREAARLTLIRETDKGPFRLVVEKSARSIWRVIEPGPEAGQAPRVDQASASALAAELARLRYTAPAAPGAGKPVLTILVESASGELLAGLEAGPPGEGGVRARALGRHRGPEEFFLLEPEIFKGLPGPWTLTNKNKDRTS